MQTLETRNQHTAAVTVRRAPSAPRLPDERAARRALRDQIARLERDLGAVFVSAFPRDGFDWSIPGRGGPRILSLGELEHVRDELATRVGEVRVELGRRAELEESKRGLVERMMLEPGRYRFVRVSRAEVGERGCGDWHVRPRFGVLGMLLNWWQVKISSGCPLVGGPRAVAAPSLR